MSNSTDEPQDAPLSDDEMTTGAAPQASSTPSAADADGTDGDADGTDGTDGDADGTDGDSDGRRRRRHRR